MRIVPLALLLLLSPVAHADQVMFTFSGTGDGAVRPFHVNAPWELQWTVDGLIVGVELARPDGTTVDAYAGKPPGGSAFQPKGGDFYLKISAVGSWTIKVVQVGN